MRIPIRQRAAAFAACTALAAALWPSSPQADPGLTSKIDPQDREAFESLIRDYLRENPEVVIEAIRAYQTEQEAASRLSAASALADSRDEIENDPLSPVVGNPDGDVTIVEFFDYRCGYCKQVLPAIQELLKTDSNIRYVFKEFPILGPDSTTAAKASLAVWKLVPDQYMDFHAAILMSRGALTEKKLLAAAEKLGIDAEAVRTEMSAPWIEEAIRKNHALGRRLGVNGTPGFVIGEQVVPGAIGLEAMQELVEQARRS